MTRRRLRAASSLFALALGVCSAPSSAVGADAEARERTVDLRSDVFELANDASFVLGQGDGYPGRAVLVRSAEVGPHARGVADLGVQLDGRGLRARRGEATIVGRRSLGFAPRGTYAGVRGSTQYLAVPGTSTLRMLVRLANPSDVVRNVRVGVVAGLWTYAQPITTSSGDRRFTTADRTLTTGSLRSFDDDAVLSQVFGGPGASAPRVTAEVAGGNAYTTHEMLVRIPPRSLRYVLLYADVAGDRAAARRHLAAFDAPRPAPPLLTGIPRLVQRRVANWNL